MKFETLCVTRVPDGSNRLVGFDLAHKGDYQAMMVMQGGHIQYMRIYKDTPSTAPQTSFMFCPVCGIDLLTNKDVRITGIERQLQRLPGPQTFQLPDRFDLSCDCGAVTNVDAHEYVALLR